MAFKMKGTPMNFFGGLSGRLARNRAGGEDLESNQPDSREEYKQMKLDRINSLVNGGAAGSIAGGSNNGFEGFFQDGWDDKSKR